MLKNKKQKVLLVVTKGTWGGAQKYVFDVACAAQQHGFDVVVVHGSEGEMTLRLRQAGVRTIAVPKLTRDVGANDLAAYYALKKAIQVERPDILHLNSSKAGALGAFAGRMLGVKNIIFTSHGWAFNEKRRMLVRVFFWLVSWFTALCAHKIIVVSDYELRATQRMPFCAHRAVRIYNGIDLNMHFGSGEKIRAAFPIGVTITGTIGELTKNKNQIALIEQAKNNLTMYVAIIGEGEDRPMLEQKVKEYALEKRVKLFGFIPAYEVMRGFDVFTLPSTKEALGYVVLEARAAGLPIVANRIGGVSEAIDKDLTEFSLEQMVTKTIALYRSPR